MNTKWQDQTCEVIGFLMGRFPPHAHSLPRDVALVKGKIHLVHLRLTEVEWNAGYTGLVVGVTVSSMLFAGPTMAVCIQVRRVNTHTRSRPRAVFSCQRRREAGPAVIVRASFMLAAASYNSSLHQS